PSLPSAYSPHLSHSENTFESCSKKTPHRVHRCGVEFFAESASASLQRGGVVLLSLRPVDHVTDRLEVVGALVLVFEVVGVFPHIDAEDRGAFDAGDGFAHD